MVKPLILPFFPLKSITSLTTSLVGGVNPLILNDIGHHKICGGRGGRFPDCFPYISMYCVCSWGLYNMLILRKQAWLEPVDPENRDQEPKVEDLNSNMTLEPTSGKVLK